MSRGDKTSYTAKQKRQVSHIEEEYEKKGIYKDEAERRAWATENKISGISGQFVHGRTGAGSQRWRSD